MAIGITRNTGSGVSEVNKKQSAKGTDKTSGQQSGSGKAARTGQSQGSDSLQLTASATQLQELENHIASLPVVDAQAVDAMQLQISTGSYEVNEKSTANKLLTSEQELAGVKQAGNTS
ncbi:MAG: flagellar biosynthesis anti-sigma factor FlgM [Chromatiales bacterium]|jgi:negative regulator of flagellin synthesis FlgM